MSQQEQYWEIALESGVFESRVTKKFTRRKLYEKLDPRIVKAQIPGVVAEIAAQPGQAVQAGDTLLILDAMKMLNRIKAPLPGVVRTLCVTMGEKVAKGQVLVEIG